MYKMNHKAIVFVFLLQLLAGAAWYYSAPVSLIGISPISFDTFPVASVFMFACSTLVYLYFTAWLLVLTKWHSSFSMMMLVVGIWLFVVLPNYVFISFYLNFSVADSIYLLSYGASSCAIAALILPLWRSSRSIFKG